MGKFFYIKIKILSEKLFTLFILYLFFYRGFNLKLKIAYLIVFLAIATNIYSNEPKLATTNDGDRIILKSDMTWELLNKNEIPEGKFCFNGIKILENDLGGSPPKGEIETFMWKKNYGSYFLITKINNLYNVKFNATDKINENEKLERDWEMSNLTIKEGKLSLQEIIPDNEVKITSKIFFEDDVLIRITNIIVSTFYTFKFERKYTKCI